MPTSACRAGTKWRGGYSLLEIMIVLAIMSVAVAIMVPRAGAALDQVVVHTVQFDLQRQISDQRRNAFVSQLDSTLRLVEQGTGSAPVISDGPGKVALVELPKGWSAKLESEAFFKANGQCGPTKIHLSSLGKRPIDMVLNERCKLIRYFSP